MNAIFDCWYEGSRLEFVGEYYQHTLMPSTFTPENTDGPRPRIVLSATGPLMTRVAAQVADGMIMHPFSSEKYMREVTLPAITEGLHDTGRTIQEFDLDYAPMIATGTTDTAIADAIEVVRDRIAFYGCTVAYKPVLDIHGWGDLQDELISLNRQHRTQDMAALISDEILETIAIVGAPEQVIDTMRERFGGVIDRTGFGAVDLADDELGVLLERLRG
jgi:probable F420-dependent oxidoreductase